MRNSAVFVTRFACEAAPLPITSAPRDGRLVMVLCSNVGNTNFTGNGADREKRFWTVGCYTDGWHVAGYDNDEHRFTSCGYRLLGWIPMPLTMKDYH